MRRTKALVLSAIVAVSATLSGCASKGIEAQEWILKQYDTTGILEMYCGELDDVVGIYVSGGMTEEQFLAEMNELSDEFDAMKAAREIDEIKIGTHTEASKVGQEAYEDVWNLLETMTKSIASDPELLEANKLAYFCMAYRDALSKDWEKYYYAYLDAGGVIDGIEDRGTTNMTEGGGFDGD